MANVNTKRIIVDGYRNAIVQLDGLLDTAGTVTIAPAVDLSADFANNDPGAGSLVGLAIKCLDWSTDYPASMQLYYNATTDELIASMAGHLNQCYEDGLIVPDQSAAGYDGDLNLVIVGSPGAGAFIAYTLKIEMIKLYSQ